jgi:hypothetical protein
MRALIAASVFLAATPDRAAACHRFSIWHYPWAQPCAVTSHPRIHIRYVPDPLPEPGKLSDKKPMDLLGPSPDPLHVLFRFFFGP